MFFTQFSQMMRPEVDYNLTISRTAAGEMVVIVLPRVRDLKDAAQHRIAPLRLIGSAEVLDRDFFASITAPIQKTAGLLVNMAEYERAQEAAAKESKAEKERQEKLKVQKEKAKQAQGSLFETPPAPKPEEPQPEPQPCCRDHEYDNYEDFPAEMLAEAM